MKRQNIFSRQPLPPKHSKEWHKVKYAFFHSRMKVCGLLFLLALSSCIYVLTSHDIRYEWVLNIDFLNIPLWLAMFVFMGHQAKVSRRELEQWQQDDRKPDAR